MCDVVFFPTSSIEKLTAMCENEIFEGWLTIVECIR